MALSVRREWRNAGAVRDGANHDITSRRERSGISAVGGVTDGPSS
jgi:hypothetical protein